MSTTTSVKLAKSAKLSNTWTRSQSTTFFPATLKSCNHCALRAAYDQILDDLDDDKDITFAHIQTICTRQFQRTKERHPDPPHSADTPRATPRTSPVKTEKYNKYKRQRGHEHVVLFCDTLDPNMETSPRQFSAAPASLKLKWQPSVRRFFRDY